MGSCLASGALRDATHTLALPRSSAPSGLAYCCRGCPSHPPGTPSSKASYHLLTKGPLLPGMAVRFQSPQLLLGGQLSLKSPTAAKTPEGGIPAQPCAEDLGHDWPLSDSVVGEPKAGGPVGAAQQLPSRDISLPVAPLQEAAVLERSTTGPSLYLRSCRAASCFL